GTRYASSPSPRKTHQLGGGILRLSLVPECLGQYPAPENIKRCFVQLLKFNFVHVGERNTAWVLLKCAIREFDSVVMPGLNHHPGAVGIEGFTEADPVCYATARDLLKIVLSGIQQCAFVAAIGSQEFSVAGNQFSFVCRYSAAGRLPVFEAKIQQSEEAAMECGVPHLAKLSHQHGAKLDF